MMKSFSNLLWSVCTIALTLGFVACDDSDEENNSLKEDIKLAATSIQEGESVNAGRTQSIKLDYKPTNIKINPDAKVTLNDVEVKAKRNPANTTMVEIAVDLEPDQEYKLIVPSGTVLGLGDATRTAPELVLNFNTKMQSNGDLSARNMINTLGFGWNLGNHFDTSSDKDGVTYPYWDKATPTQKLYENLAEMGVKTVRMPVTWGNFQGEAPDYVISETYMEEVAQNVNWALEAGLYVILNTHHDEYWQNIMEAVKSGQTNNVIVNRIEKTWTQIATRFKDANDHLIFETFNEIHDENWGWNQGYNYSSVYQMMNSWNQKAVNAIRTAEGGNYHWIGVPGFCANADFTIGHLTLPADEQNKIMVAVHSYDPFNFCTEGSVQQWGYKVNGNNKSQEKAVVTLFENLKKTYLDKDVPCYIGEFGAVTRKSSADEKYRTYFLEYFCRCAYLYGLPVMLWDNNNNGSGERFYYINHNDGTLYNESLVRTMIEAATSSDATYTLESISDKQY